MFTRAMQNKQLRLVFGTDAVAGAHGRNADEFIYRVRDGKQPFMDALVSATSRAAEALGLQDTDRRHLARARCGSRSRSTAIRGKM